MATDNKLIDQAMGVARCLSYNDKQQSAAKHMLHELCHRLGARTVRIHKTAEGYLMTTLYGASRLLTRREAFMWRWLGAAPAGMVVELAAKG